MNCEGMPTSLFFPVSGDNVTMREARAVCEGCPVQDPCREYALEHRINYGVWGGTSATQRRGILRTRAREAILAS